MAGPANGSHAADVVTGLHRLTLADLSNLAVEGPDTPMHEGALGVLDGGPLLDGDGHVRIDHIRACLARKLDRVPELRRVLFQTGPLQGRPLWVDDPDFRIENHILVSRLPEPGGAIEARRFAEEKMAGLMDRSRPLWELWFLEGYRELRVGLLLKVHHVLADGPAILNMLGQLFDLSPVLEEPGATAWAPARPPTPRELAVDNLARKGRLLATTGRRLVHPITWGRSIATSVRAVWDALEEGRGAPRSSLNRPVGSGRRIGVLHLRLDEVKSVAHANGVKVNDVFLDLVAGGLREVLISREEPVGGKIIHASMAVSMHPAGDASRSGNQVGTMIVPLPVGVDDARSRLVLVGAATKHAKARQRAAVPQTLMMLLAVSGLTRIFIRRQRLVNVLATNLPGPPVPLFVAGARLLDAFAIPPIAGNVTASFAALSYDGGFDISVLADASAWPDLDVLVDGMRSTWVCLSRSISSEPDAPPEPDKGGRPRPPSRSQPVTWSGLAV
jgi:diacylglycerol O-acyltransferase / wax synthase